ncbi:Glutathione S-transferase S1 [Linnemannia hyalina]|uniref:Glutathione S-transferase S1 n=1 Tax=Linnemannia hyalina TaxID=64524 RepID=A0A9P7XTY5_9FUNG|nr:Glutathione S-transferase S1 [Linnemannia hyalina]
MTTLKAQRPYFTGNTSEENAQVLADPNPTYKLMYLDIGSVGATARDIMAFGKANWSSYVPNEKDWNEGKIPAPFKVLPVLTVSSPSNGKEVVISESVPVDHFLAKRFNLLGNNEWEEYTIKAVYNNIHHFRERSLTTMSYTFGDKKHRLEHYLKVVIPNFIGDHEFHLRANGSNGHYLGDKLSLADIHLVSLMDHFLTLPVADDVIAQFKKSELIMKVRERVEANPEIAAWRKSEDWKRFNAGSIAIYADSAPPGYKQTAMEG